jgi:hypothetical protein
VKRILCSLLVAILPLGSVLADAPKSKNAKVTLVYQHELPNVPGKSFKGSSTTAWAATRVATRIRNPHSSARPCLRERSAVRSTTVR